jgi:hypothetical protein
MRGKAKLHSLLTHLSVGRLAAQGADEETVVDTEAGPEGGVRDTNKLSDQFGCYVEDDGPLPLALLTCMRSWKTSSDSVVTK